MTIPDKSFNSKKGSRQAWKRCLTTKSWLIAYEDWFQLAKKMFELTTKGPRVVWFKFSIWLIQILKLFGSTCKNRFIQIHQIIPNLIPRGGGYLSLDCAERLVSNHSTKRILAQKYLDTPSPKNGPNPPPLHHRRNCIWNHTLPDQFRDKLGRQAHKGGHSIPDRADTLRKHWEPNSELFWGKNMKHATTSCLYIFEV